MILFKVCIILFTKDIMLYLRKNVFNNKQQHIEDSNVANVIVNWPILVEIGVFVI